MSGPRRAILASVMMLAGGAALWLAAALRLLPPAAWPAWPLDAAVMDVQQIVLGFGLMPRGVIALIAGAALGLSGALLQAVLRNPLADPTTLGISGGAQLALVLATILSPGLLVSVGPGPLALLGAGVAAALVLAIGAARGFAPAAVVVAGMLVGMTASAIATAVTLAQGHYLLSLVIWNGGALNQQDWSSMRALAAVLVAGGCGAALLARPMRVLSLGGAGARGLGLNVAAVRVAAVALAAWLAASVSAHLGLIAFVGLAGPALARALGARSVAAVLGLSPLAGAGVLSLADGLALTFEDAAGLRLPAGAVTGLIGGPLMIVLLGALRGTTPPGTETAGAMPARAARPGPVLAALGAVVLTGVVAFACVGRLPGGWTLLDGTSVVAFLPMRLPRLIAAGSAGASLALAGAVLQRLTANPLAAPEVLGVSGGASLGYAAVVLAGAAQLPGAAAAGAMAGAGAALAGVMVFAARRDMPPERVLLAGVAISATAASVLSAIMAQGDARAFAILGWLGGTAAGVTPAGALGIAAAAAGVWVAALALVRWLAALPLGSGVALSLGLPVAGARAALITLAGLATGAATILVGPLSFVGLMAPHLARRAGLARPADHLTGAALIGAGLMLAADFGARVAAFPYELPLGLFASLIGAPWLILTLTRTR